jgi:C-terminal processing protease CtpA/Prc
MDNIFPDIELSNTKNGGGSKEEDWEALQPQRPEPNRPTRERMMGEQPQTQSQPQTQPQPLKKQQQAQQKLQHLQPQPKLQSAVMESRQKTGYMVTEDDATDGGRSLNTFNTLENIYSGEADNASYQSYGYSLDDGIGSKLSISPGTTQMNSAATESGPMKMDLYALNSSRYNFIDDDDTLELSVGTPGSIYSGLTTDDASLQVDKKSALDSADRKMPAAEGDDMSSSFIRECQAPPGKLGIIIDTTKDGPVVYQVKSGSPLENIIFAGDRIIAIDDIDTRGMTASNVTKIVARKCDEPRKITVSSKTFKGTF